MAQVVGTLPYARGRVFPLTLGANASVINSALSTYDIPRDQCAYGTFNGKEYMCAAYWLSEDVEENPAATSPGVLVGLLKQALITTTPNYPNGVLIMYFLPYTVNGAAATGSPRFLYYGPNFTTRGYWAVVQSYTSNNAVLSGKYLFERDPATHKYRFTNAAGAKVSPYRTGILPISAVNSIVGTNYKFIVYYLPLR